MYVKVWIDVSVGRCASVKSLDWPFVHIKKLIVPRSTYLLPGLYI